MIAKQNVIIVGAPRSGTNMLRDILTTFDGVETWPCDEINYIWRHGNVGYPSDEIPVDAATANAKDYIRKCFESIRRQSGAEIVLEKTCANSLRVPFVDAVVPDAKYIYIVRDGIDTTGSARLRWTAELDLPYLFKKVRYVPLFDLPYYAIRYFWSRVFLLFSKEKRLAFWGPKLDDMDVVLANHSLNEVCAIQWQRCVDKADNAFSVMPEGKVMSVRYEDFVASPGSELQRILDFLEYSTPSEVIVAAVKGVSNKSLGKGRQSLGEKEIKHLENLVGDTLRRHGYL